MRTVIKVIFKNAFNIFLTVESGAPASQKPVIFLLHFLITHKAYFLHQINSPERRKNLHELQGASSKKINVDIYSNVRITFWELHQTDHFEQSRLLVYR